MHENDNISKEEQEFIDHQNGIIDKLDKLSNITLANGALQTEVETALMLMHKLLIKHNIDMDSLGKKKDTDRITFKLVRNHYRKTHERRYWFWDLLGVLGYHNSCKVIRYGDTGNYDYKIFGVESHIDTIIKTFDVLVPIIRNICLSRYNEYKKSVEPFEPETRRVFTTSYIAGFIEGLDNKYTKATKEEDTTGKFGLMLINQLEVVKKHLAKNENVKIIKTSTASTHLGCAYVSGEQDGSDNLSNKLNK